MRNTTCLILSYVIPATVAVDIAVAVDTAVAVAVGGTPLAIGEVLELVVEVFEGCVLHLGLDAHNIGKSGRRKIDDVQVSNEFTGRGEFTPEGVNEE